MKIIIIQDKSPKGKIALPLTIRDLSLRKEFAPRRSEFFPLKEVPFCKETQYYDNYCTFQLSPFNMRNGTLINKYTCMDGETVFQ